MDGWDLLILIVVAYVAITSLVRLMLQRRDQLLKDLQQQLDSQLRTRQAGPETQDQRAA